ncbi:MAG TPA: hypothetical protein VGN88_11425, partial [Phycisphaerae bacterium]
MDTAPLLGYASDPSSTWDSGILWTLVIAGVLGFLSAGNWAINWALARDWYLKRITTSAYLTDQLTTVLFYIALPVLQFLVTITILISLGRRQMLRLLRILCL